jgi:diacylglycerol kinase family enzyme
MTDMEHAFIIVNPVSGLGNAKDRTDKILSAARALGWKGVFAETTPEKNAGSIAAAAIKKGTTHIVACGGDGTILEVLTAAVKKAVVVGIVPLGTGNLFARNLDIPLRLEDAMQIALTGKVIRVDVGRANEC